MILRFACVIKIIEKNFVNRKKRIFFKCREIIKNFEKNVNDHSIYYDEKVEMNLNIDQNYVFEKMMFIKKFEKFSFQICQFFVFIDE